MWKRITWIAVLALASMNLSAQSSRIKDFTPACDSVNLLIGERTSIEGELKLKNIIQRGNCLDFYFTESLGDYPWKEEDIAWFRKEFKKWWPDNYRRFKTGDIYSRGVNLEKLATNHLDNSGNATTFPYRTGDPKQKTPVIVTRLDERQYSKGLSGRTIALWQSHGRYFDHNTGRWHWQRPCLFTTTEDLFTQGFVLDFLVPMLENAGAYTMLPRERDTQKQEYIIDNDPYRTKGSDRKHGILKTRGKWEISGSGFADNKPFYEHLDNPFTMGTTLKANEIASGSKAQTAKVEWIPEIAEKGEYAVYISYQSLPESTTHASYKVIHNGGTTSFSVNQQIGGSTWIYLGTFTFVPEAGHKVILENRCPKGYGHEDGAIVTADAVKIGGGTGNIARKREGDEHEAITSGLPRYLEGARYWLQWAGVDSTIFSQHEQKQDYKDDFMSRGPWVEYLTGGSYLNPEQEGKGIPVDLSFALHSDAGVKPDDATVGTLAIYTYKSDNKTEYPSGESRMQGREYADLVQSQLVNDVRTLYDSTWNRRYIWDRYYSECRRPSCPALLLEFLSHQNFADMKYGTDPSFRFTVCRSIYKGMLKFLSNRYGIPYVVQPLPVQDFTMSKVPGEDIIILKWKTREDKLEPTAVADGFILETRIDGSSFNNGEIIKPIHTQDGIYLYPVRMEKDKLYSFRIRAWNAGGKSFPSEILSAGFPKTEDEAKAGQMVLVVNNFDRVSSPVWFDTPDYGGFDAGTDRGVPYMRDITYMGDIYEFRKGKEWVTNDNSGFGACHRNYTGTIVAGNTFDYPSVHGRLIMATGRPFISTSGAAFTKDKHLTENVWSIDMICGKQVTTISGTGHMPARFTVFSEKMQERISSFCNKGGNILISGSNVATDIWDTVYPINKDSTFTETSKAFAREVLGFSWGGNHAGKTGQVVPAGNDPDFATADDGYRFYTEPNPYSYSVESPDGILAAGEGSRTILRYADSEVSAGIRCSRKNYKTVVLGFPIETLKNKKEMEDIIRTTLGWFDAAEKQTCYE